MGRRRSIIWDFVAPNASEETLVRRAVYGGRKGRRAKRRLGLLYPGAKVDVTPPAILSVHVDAVDGPGPTEHPRRGRRRDEEP